jgi:hypothetical protein
MRFMFEPLASGLLDDVAHVAREQGLRFGFGGVARAGEGLLPGQDVLAEHLRLGSQAVILSRTFHRPMEDATLESGVAALRQEEQRLARRSAEATESDRMRVVSVIERIASMQAQPGVAP